LGNGRGKTAVYGLVLCLVRDKFRVPQNLIINECGNVCSSFISSTKYIYTGQFRKYVMVI